MPNPPPPPKPAKAQPRTIFSAFTVTWREARERRAKREQAAEERRDRRRKPRPWILRKAAVGFVIALLIWLQYVYVRRLCVPMIRRDAAARGTFGQGIAYLVVYEVLWLMTAWCYVKIITVPPGFAKDHIKKTPPPNEMQQTRTTSPETWGPSTQRASTETAPLRTSRSLQPLQEKRPEVPRSAASAGSVSSGRSRAGPIEFPENNPIARPFGRTAGSPTNGTANGAAYGTANGTSEMDAVPGFVKVHASRAPVSNGGPKRPEPAVRPSWEAPPPRDEGETWGENLPPSRKPNHPVLNPDRRYCYKCEVVKPYRSHHCSTCATDVLMFDHHCLWIGQCVGARNRKFFVNFLEWGVLLAIYIFITLVVANASLAYSNDLDGEMIAVIAISGFFMLFTAMLLSSHVWLLTINATTVEHMWMQQLQQRDTAALSTRFSIWNPVAKGRQRAQWNDEWGSLYSEGNIWWLGSRRVNWEATMGKSPLGWFLPIGRSQSDGLSYPVNPRFSPSGRWRRRSDWPAELQ
ncbi:zf-DHHC-domain-containing protein [Calocera viscosa TUFC12733]|uniref:Palmitoyltransferase n=1 Tax=Calocera viscosa (strain TUFC12733) TaxID=1330018 RepID=A0A167PIX6_CALVF|nr:zf-DHHC-domain-containing protein [Calocera viscosa TUFC12733]